MIIKYSEKYVDTYRNVEAQPLQKLIRHNAMLLCFKEDYLKNLHNRKILRNVFSYRT